MLMQTWCVHQRSVQPVQWEVYWIAAQRKNPEVRLYFIDHQTQRKSSGGQGQGSGFLEFFRSHQIANQLTVCKDSQGSTQPLGMKALHPQILRTNIGHVLLT